MGGRKEGEKETLSERENEERFGERGKWKEKVRSREAREGVLRERGIARARERE